jgi:hypothetical protein
MGLRAGHRDLIRAAIVTAFLAAMAGCSAPPASQPSQPLAAVQSPPQAVRACPPLDPAIAAEAIAVTPAERLAAGGAPALSAALMASEIRKNARLRVAIESYRLCREKFQASSPHAQPSQPQSLTAVKDRVQP